MTTQRMEMRHREVILNHGFVSWDHIYYHSRFLERVDHKSRESPGGITIEVNKPTLFQFRDPTTQVISGDAGITREFVKTGTDEDDCFKIKGVTLTGGSEQREMRKMSINSKSKARRELAKSAGAY